MIHEQPARCWAPRVSGTVPTAVATPPELANKKQRQA